MSDKDGLTDVCKCGHANTDHRAVSPYRCTACDCGGYWEPTKAERLEAEVATLREQLDEYSGMVRERDELLTRLLHWDHMGTAADGEYWQGEINRLLTGQPEDNQ